MRLTQLSALELVGVVSTAVAGVAGAVGAVLALTGGPDPVPQADLKVTRYEPNVTRGDFVRRFPEAATEALLAQDPETNGGALFLDLAFDDFDGRRCRLTWTMHDDANDAPMTTRRWSTSRPASSSSTRPPPTTRPRSGSRARPGGGRLRALPAARRRQAVRIAVPSDVIPSSDHAPAVAAGARVGS